MSRSFPSSCVCPRAFRSLKASQFRLPQYYRTPTSPTGRRLQLNALLPLPPPRELESIAALSRKSAGKTAQHTDTRTSH